MKLTSLLYLTAAIQATTTIADQFQVEWITAAGHLSFYASWRSSSGGGSETVLRFGDGCYNNPGPKGMQRLCLANVEGYGEFTFQGQGRRCLRRTLKEGKDTDPAGREVWDEVACV